MLLATQFTEDVFATEDSVCQRTSCQAPILRGQPRHYVRSINDARRGKYYCGKCFERIQNSLSTVNVSPLPDAQSIRRSISAAQSRGKQCVLSHLLRLTIIYSDSESTSGQGNRSLFYASTADTTSTIVFPSLFSIPVPVSWQRSFRLHRQTRYSCSICLEQPSGSATFTRHFLASASLHRVWTSACALRCSPSPLGQSFPSTACGDILNASFRNV